MQEKLKKKNREVVRTEILMIIYKQDGKNLIKSRNRNKQRKEVKKQFIVILNSITL